MLQLWKSAISNSMRRAFRDKSGGVAVIFAVAAPAMFGLVGLSIDYSNWLRTKSLLQSLADEGALAGARELRLGNSNDALVAQVVASDVSSGSARLQTAPTITTTVAPDHTSASVTLNADIVTVFPQSLGLPFAQVTANARARVLGGAPLCMLSLDPLSAVGVSASLVSKVSASGCTVYSNSRSKAGITVTDLSNISAGFTCSGGGVLGTSQNFSPAPQSDCPALADPLVNRAPPSSGGCDYINAVIPLGSQTISPGVYCGGLNIALGAKVTANPGVYVIKDGPLTVSLNASLTGVDVGFYLTGPTSIIAFLAGSNIDISAPLQGPMAGLLIWENAATALGVTPHIIYSENAHNLLGTIYLPKGTLVVGSPNPVANASAYTIIIASAVNIVSSPQLVLNSRYGASLVPVPDGAGNRNQRVQIDL